MPIYEYQCKICGHQLEILQKFSDEPLTECPECKKRLNIKVPAGMFEKLRAETPEDKAIFDDVTDVI